MPDPIFIMNHDRKLKRAEQSPYEKESMLQQLVNGYLELIPGTSLGGSSLRRWLPIYREAGIPNEERDGNWWALSPIIRIDDEQ